jgi:putative ABC transport system substrate-binding protein
LQQAEKYASDLGLEIVTAPVNNTGEVLAAAQSIVGRVDAFYMINDNTVLAGQESLIKISLENKKPLIAIEESGVEMGALATLGTTYSKVGERAAELAIKVINGESPANLSVVDITDSDLFLNKKTALAIGIQLPEDLLGKAVKVYEE